MPYIYVLSFSIPVLGAILLLSRFTLRRQTAGTRGLVLCPEATGNVAGETALRLKMHVPRRHIPAVNTQTLSVGLEYHFHSKLGLLTIAPHRNLPTAVELLIGGKVWGTFISAEFAANAVGFGATNHKELDALSASERPAKLEDWEQSRPYYFRT